MLTVLLQYLCYDHCFLLLDPSTQWWVINAITRLVAQIGYLPEYVHSMVALHLTSVDTDVQQVNHTHSLTLSLTVTHSPTHSPTYSLTRSLTHSITRSLDHPPTHSLTHPLSVSLTSQRCSELIEFTQSLPLMQEVLPLDSACEDLEVTAHTK